MQGYEFTNFSLQLASAKRRNYWGTVNYNWGDFFSGSRKDYGLAFGAKVAVPLFLGYEWELSDISLPDKSFKAIVYRMNLNVLVNPRITLDNFIQYDNVSEKMGWQSRFRWIFQPGNEIFLVWNSITIDPLSHIQIDEGTLRFKIRYNYRF